MTRRKNRLSQLLQLIDNVYEAALDETHWQGLGPQIAHTFQSSSTSLLTQVGSDSKLLTVTDNVAQAMSQYQSYYWQKDIWVQRAAERVGISQVGTSRDMVSDSEFEETEFYRDWCRHLDVFYVMGGVFPTGPNQLGVLGIHRPRAAKTYDSNDTSLASGFLPHLQRALRIRAQLAQAAMQRRVSIETLERSDTAVLLVAPDGLIVHANRLAEALLTDGTVICQRNGRLNGTRGTEGARLSVLIREATGMVVRAGDDIGRGGDGIMTLRRVNRQPLSILVSPFRMALTGQCAGGAIVFIRDPERSLSAIAHLRALFRFTPAEARIAQALANGQSIAEIAAAHRASLHTVRKQLKTILAKTGTNRQAQCVSLILRSVVTIARN